jgi:hypothetical protein
MALWSLFISNLTSYFLLSTKFTPVSMDIGFMRTPDTNPFFVVRTLSKDNVVETFYRRMIMSSFPILKAFLRALLTLNKFTQRSGTNLSSGLKQDLKGLSMYLLNLAS